MFAEHDNSTEAAQKKGGEWVFVSHQRVTFDEVYAAGEGGGAGTGVDSWFAGRSGTSGTDDMHSSTLWLPLWFAVTARLLSNNKHHHLPPVATVKQVWFL